MARGWGRQARDVPCRTLGAGPAAARARTAAEQVVHRLARALLGLLDRLALAQVGERVLRLLARVARAQVLERRLGSPGRLAGPQVAQLARCPLPALALLEVLHPRGCLPGADLSLAAQVSGALGALLARRVPPLRQPRGQPARPAPCLPHDYLPISAAPGGPSPASRIPSRARSRGRHGPDAPEPSDNCFRPLNNKICRVSVFVQPCWSGQRRRWDCTD